MLRILKPFCSVLVEAAVMLAFSAPLALSAPIASGDLIVTATAPCCNNPGPSPNVYQLDQTGTFKGWFFSPFSPSDIAVNKSGQILFSSSNSGTIVETDNTGSFLGFVTTPVPGIAGLAVEANGDLLAANGSQIYQLDPTGKFLGLVFSPSPINSPIGVDPEGELVALIASPCCSNAPASLEFLNLTTRVTRTVLTGLSAINGLTVDESGNIWAIGSRSGFNNNCGFGGCSIFELDGNGDVLAQLAGPQNPQLVAVANLPEPSTATLMVVGIAGLATVTRRCRPSV